MQHDVALGRQQIAVQVGACSKKVELVSPFLVSSTRQQTLLEDLLVEIVVGAMNQGGDSAGVDPLVHRVVVHLFRVALHGAQHQDRAGSARVVQP